MTVSRRNLMRNTVLTAGGLSLSPLGSSIFGQLKARAADVQKAPLRFVFMLRENGLFPAWIQPKGMEGLAIKPAVRSAPAAPKGSLRLPAGTEFGDALLPLKPFWPRVSILQGMNSDFLTYHTGGYATLGAYWLGGEGSSRALGPTVDHLLARAFPSPFSHLLLGYDRNSPAGTSYIRMSAAGNKQPLPFYNQPAKAYQDLFGVVAEGDAKNDYAAQSKVLDFFREDARRIRASVAAPEREQLDRYLQGFEEVGKTRQDMEKISDKLRKHRPDNPGAGYISSKIGVERHMADIAASALVSGLTNVVTFALSGQQYNEIWGKVPGGASIGHSSDEVQCKFRPPVVQFHLEQMAHIAKTLDSVPEGDGTMLDNTVFVYSSNNGEAHHASGNNWPFLILGNLGGRLATNHYYAPGNSERGKKEQVRLGDLWSTFLAAAGQPYKDFGRPKFGGPFQPIEELIAS